jgi:hypothetical protein
LTYDLTFNWHTVYLREPGTPKRELTFMRDAESSDVWGSGTVAIADAPMWAMKAGWVKHKFRILVFDENHMIHRRDLEFVDNISIDARNDISFRDGNRRVVYPTSQGWKSLDMIDDTVTPAKKPESILNE